MFNQFEELAECLGFKQEDIDSFLVNSLSKTDSMYKMLNTWYKTVQVTESRRSQLCEAVRKAGRHDLADEVEKIDIPYAISARGKEVEKAYIEALKEGQVEVNLGMVKVIGQEGVGKTCLINACLGKKFNKEHLITDGIAVIKTVETKAKEQNNWTEDLTDDCGNPIELYRRLAKENISKTIEDNKKGVAAASKPHSSTEKEKSRPNKRDKGITFFGMNWETIRQKINSFFCNQFIEFEVNTETPAKVKDVSKKSTAEGTEDTSLNAQQSLDKDIIQDIFSKQEVKRSPLETFNIWDHGGQLIYQGIHQIFVTSEAVYVAVFDLSKDLDDPAIVMDPNGQQRKHHWTNRQFLLSSILSIYSHSRILGENIEKEVNLPAILVVGTHKASLGETEEEQNEEAEVVLKKVKDSMKGKPYEKHVLGYYAVENSRETTDKSFSDLKKVIQDLMNHLKKIKKPQIELLLIDGEDVERVNKYIYLGTIIDEKLTWIDQAMVKEMARQNGIGNESQQLIMLNFLYDLGDIIYLPDNELLRNQVVLDPMSLVQFVTAFVKVVTPDEFKVSGLMLINKTLIRSEVDR
ncbi:uncharacterized protein [Antedon mediterranea]|uniref:uncharacterized protein n=1 Tax=Antedon mediterranea TaxID=105859 RepID=UPI003AF71087